MSKKQKKLFVRIIISLFFFVIAGLTEYFTDFNKYVYLLIYAVPYLIAGYDVLRGFFRNIIKGQIFDEQFLMTVATVGAIIIGEYPESVFVMVFYQTGELFQSIAVGRSRKSISELMDICPDFAVVIKDGAEETVLPEEVSVGSLILVKPGEKIPLDGTVKDGTSSVDMSSLTGESVPVEIQNGSQVLAGSINLTGTLKIITTKEYSDSTVAKILELVENSSLNKAKSEKFLTKFAKYYTPAVTIGAVLVGLIPSIITGNPKTWVYRALIFLVVSCPCALVISVPLSFFGGIGSASKKGILIKGANFLEALADTKTVVFDKTGTLTTGKFSVKGIFPVNGYSEKELLETAAQAEYYSSHPIAKSIVAEAGIKKTPINIKEYPGSGIEAETEYGKVFAGRFRFLVSMGIDIPEGASEGTRIYVALNGIYMGNILLGDTVKENTHDALETLTSLGVEEQIMLTGDNESAARYAADYLGIKKYYASLLPQDKVEKVDELCKNKPEKSTLVFVGDGINDAPVLTRADVGIAMGGVGSDAAIEAADVVIMDDDIGKIGEVLKIATKTKRIVIENVVFALGVKFAVLLLAAFGLANMWIGVFADVGVSVIAILNAMRCLR